MVLLDAPANDNDRAETVFVWRGPCKIYRIRAGELVASAGDDKILVASASRRPRVHCARTGAFLGELKP
jgi:hypothetical protein